MAVSTKSQNSLTLAKKIYINGAFRTPIGKFGGALNKLTAPELAATLLQECVKVTGMSTPDYVIMGHGRQAGAGPNTARQAAIFAGLANTIPAWTINHACASGISALVHGVEKILLSRAENLWVGGVESMSNTPYLLPTVRWGQKLGNQKLLDAMYQDGFHCPLAGMVMGETVERFIASERKISRSAQDEFALMSHQRAVSAWKKGEFKSEVIPVQHKLGNLEQDETPRADASLEALAKLPPAFLEGGTLTAGNSSAIVDGASWIWISDKKEKSALAEIIDYEVTALDPKLMGIGPVQSITNLLARNSLKISDIEAIEINEAFTAQVLACQNDLKIPTEKLNIRGGATALGHPIGATGARILTTLSHILAGKSGALGIASLCVSGGQGYSVLIRAL
jgi:acetyl-CoA C-acetyltransferase